MQLGSLHAVSPTGTEKGIQPRAANHHSEDPPLLWEGQACFRQNGFCNTASQITEKSLL